MPHVRSTIRDDAKAALIGLGATVRVTRKFPTNVSELPRIHVYTLSERVDEAQSSLSVQTRVLSLVTELIATGTEDAIDNTLDDLAVSVEDALTGTSFSTSVLDSQLTTTEIEVDSSGETPVGAATLTFSVLYRTTRGVPQTAV